MTDQRLLDGIEFVYFDLDDTLLDHRHAEAGALGDLHAEHSELKRFPLETVRDTYRRVNRRVWEEYTAGTRDKEGTRSGRFALLFEALGTQADAVAAADRYLEAYADHWRLIDGAEEGLACVAEVLPTGLLTNGFVEAQRSKLQRFPDLADVFRSIVISEEHGVMKPHPALFRAAAEIAGHSPESILYIGDSLGSDVIGGTKAGWTVVWYGGDAAEAPSGVPVFHDWAELPTVLGLE